MRTATKAISIILFLLIFIIALSSEKQKSEWKGKIETIDGVKVVHNFKNDLFKPLKFVEDLSIGIEEGDENYMFSNPKDIDSDSKGNIYVLDSRECTVKKYDSQGKHIKNIGRKGQGPGEFEMPYFFELSQQDKIYVGDTLARKIDIFKANGGYLKTLEAREWIDQVSINQKEELIAGFKSPMEGENKEVKFIYEVCKYDSKMNKIFEFYSQKQVFTFRISDGEFTLDYPIFVKWDIDSKDNVYIGTANKYEINVFSSKGSLLFKLSLDFKPIPVTGEAQRKSLEILNRLKDVINFQETRKLLEFYPVFNSISIDEKDQIWIEHYQPYWRDKPRKEATFDVFSSDGKFLFSTKIDKSIFPKLTFKNGYIYILATEESGFSRALRLRIVEN